MHKQADLPAHPADDLPAALSASLDRHAIPGAAIAVWHDGRLRQAAAGVLNTHTAVAATSDSLFHVGSVSKAFTATLIMQQFAAGRLRLDRPVVEILPEFGTADPEASRAITPRQLLSHCSGLDGDLMDDVGRNADAVARLVARLSVVGQLHPPGALFSYCNIGYVVLGRIVEVLTGQDWSTALEERLLQPLGCRHSVTLPEQALAFRTAVGHWTDPASGQPVLADTRFAPRSNAPSGTMLTMSAADLVRFGRMHLDDGQAADGTPILSPEVVAMMRQPAIATPYSDRYTAWGLGWARADRAGREVFGHDGGGDGTNAFLRVVPDAGLIIALLANHGRASGLFEDLVEPLLQRLAGLPAAESPAMHAPAAVSPAPYVGRYARHGQWLDLRLEHGRLQGVWGGEYVGEGMPLELSVAGTGHFVARTPSVPKPLSIRFFDFTADGRPRYLQFTERAFRRVPA